MPDDGPDVVPLPLASTQLAQLVHCVTQRHRRIDLVDPESGAMCVLISKSELDSLESALESLSQLPAVSQLHQDVRRLAKLVSETDFSTAAVNSVASSRFQAP